MRSLAGIIGLMVFLVIAFYSAGCFIDNLQEKMSIRGANIAAAQTR